MDYQGSFGAFLGGITPGSQIIGYIAAITGDYPYCPPEFLGFSRDVPYHEPESQFP